MNGNRGDDKQTLGHELQETAGGAFSALPPFDPADYLEDLQAFDLTEAQKIEFLQTLWHIMAAFVDLGWGVNSLHYVLPGLAQISSNCESHTVEDMTANPVDGAAGNETPEGEPPP